MRWEVPMHPRDWPLMPHGVPEPEHKYVRPSASHNAPGDSSSSKCCATFSGNVSQLNHCTRMHTVWCCRDLTLLMPWGARQLTTCRGVGLQRAMPCKCLPVSTQMVLQALMVVHRILLRQVRPRMTRNSNFASHSNKPGWVPRVKGGGDFTI